MLSTTLCRFLLLLTPYPLPLTSYLLGKRKSEHNEIRFSPGSVTRSDRPLAYFCSAASNNVGISIFFILSIACITRFDFSLSGS